VRHEPEAGRNVTAAGVVLTGGASRRMGRNKALVDVDGTPLADRVATALRRGGCDPVVAIGGDPDALAALTVPVVPDRRPGQGPLGGILDGLELFDVTDGSALGPPTGWMLAVACDLPDLTPAVVQELTAVGAATTPGAVDVVVARTHRLEPAVAMWSLASRPAVSAMYQGGERAVHRVIRALRHVEVDVDAAALRNVNTPDDLVAGPDSRDGRSSSRTPLDRLDGVMNEITVQDLAALGPDARVVDVREPAEWAAGHVAHAVHVPLATVPEHLDAFDGTPTYVICRSGNRSGQACEYVAGHGIDAVNVVGGMLAWADAGYPIESGDAGTAGSTGG